MANTIILKNSSTASAVPVAGDLTAGELALNTADRKLYTKTVGGVVVEAVVAAQAWVNFNGTGTVAIRASYGVSSVTGVGSYTANFTTAMGSANYAANVTAQNTVSSDYCSIAVGGITTSALGVSSFNSSGTNVDVSAVCVSVFQ
jgi:hypothetical protein